MCLIFWTEVMFHCTVLVIHGKEKTNLRDKGKHLDLNSSGSNSPCSESESISDLKGEAGATGKGLRGLGLGVGGVIHFFPMYST